LKLYTISFFLKHARELRIVILRRRKEGQMPHNRKGHHKHTHTQTQGLGQEATRRRIEH
jgi:hypothetical protein